MKHIHFDSLGGASGDMILGALLDLGVNKDDLQNAFARLSVEPITLHTEQTSDRALSGTRATIHTREHHTHDHHAHDRHAPHRNLTDILALIAASNLPEPAQERARATFQRLGEAEARIHGVPLDDIHFHEVGALDSIADIVGSCLALHLLGVDSVSVGALPQGHGTIHCAHGVFPNPAPATLALLQGMTVTAVDEPFELVTPTGAALLSTWKTAETPPDQARVARIGYGLGQRTLNGRPNVLRATLYETAETDATVTTCLLLECQLDDSSPEWIGALTEQLLKAGALDVFTYGVQMKKQRPGIALTVLCQPAHRMRMLDLLFTESTTFGVRETLTQRAILTRRIETVTTPYGDVRIKIGQWQGRDVTRSPEMDDCMALAQQQGIPVRQVYDSALRALSAPP